MRPVNSQVQSTRGAWPLAVAWPGHDHRGSADGPRRSSAASPTWHVAHPCSPFALDPERRAALSLVLMPGFALGDLARLLDVFTSANESGAAPAFRWEFGRDLHGRTRDKFRRHSGRRRWRRDRAAAALQRDRVQRRRCLGRTIASASPPGSAPIPARSSGWAASAAAARCLGRISAMPKERARGQAQRKELFWRKDDFFGCRGGCATSDFALANVEALLGAAVAQQVHDAAWRASACARRSSRPPTSSIDRDPGRAADQARRRLDAQHGLRTLAPAGRSLPRPASTCATWSGCFTGTSASARAATTSGCAWRAPAIWCRAPCWAWRRWPKRWVSTRFRISPNAIWTPTEFDQARTVSVTSRRPGDNVRNQGLIRRVQGQPGLRTARSGARRHAALDAKSRTTNKTKRGI